MIFGGADETCGGPIFGGCSAGLRNSGSRDSGGAHCGRRHCRPPHGAASDNGLAGRKVGMVRKRLRDSEIRVNPNLRIPQKNLSADEGTRTPTPVKAPDPKSGVATNYTTSAGIVSAKVIKKGETAKAGLAADRFQHGDILPDPLFDLVHPHELVRAVRPRRVARPHLERWYRQ